MLSDSLLIESLFGSVAMEISSETVMDFLFVSFGVSMEIMIIIGFWETAHSPLPYANINTYFSLRAKCRLREGAGGQFPRNV